jgi:hypothetical protein
MALAAYYDVENALGRSLTESEEVITLLEDASDLVIGYLGGVAPNPVPPAVARVVGTMVAAVLTKPAVSTADYGASGYNSQREAAVVRVGQESATSTGPWLTASLKQRLQPYRTNVVSILLHSEVAP